MHIPMIIITNSEMTSRSCFLKIHFTVCTTPANIRPPKMNKLKALKNINTLFNSNHRPCLDVHIIPVMLVYYQVPIPISTCEIKFLHNCRFSKPIDNSVHFYSSLFSKNERRCSGACTRDPLVREYQMLSYLSYTSLLIITCVFSASYSGLFIGKSPSLGLLASFLAILIQL